MQQALQIIPQPALEDMPLTLAEAVASEVRAPAHTVTIRIEKVIEDRLKAHFSSLKFGGEPLSVRDLDVLDEAEAYILRKIRERSV